MRAHVRLTVALSEAPPVHVGFEITPTQPHLPLAAFTDLLRVLNGRWQWRVGAKDQAPGLRIYTQFDDNALGLLEQTVFIKDLGELRRWCDALCPMPLDNYDDEALRKAYKPFDKVLTPLLPWPCAVAPALPALADWARDLYELLYAGFPGGIAGETPVERRLALTMLAAHCLVEGGSLGRLALTGIDPQKLLRLVKEAPGYVVVPGRALEMNTNPYERGEAVKNLLHTLAEEHAACVFEGSYAELQTLFHGGQGGEQDPLNPVVCRVPQTALEPLARFALWDTAQQRDLTLPTDIAATATAMCSALAARPSSARRLLLPLAHRTLTCVGAASDCAAFADRLSGHTETFGAVGVRPRMPRPGEVQRRFQEQLSAPEFEAFLKTRLFGQEPALDAYIAKLREEIFTRPLYQPLAIALQGTPGTGKSESLMLTAQWLGVPHVVIDAASIPDTYTGMAQLLGSGRGIVGSHQAGRLEQVARHHLGAVVEIADLDHATPSVRSSLGDLFLQIMQTGEAQSSVGAMFSCAGLLLGFSLNLPGGKDEKAYQQVGFGKGPTMDDVRRDVRKEIKNMVSGAFLSRLGEPVLFAPLSEEARVAIIDRALRDALETGLERLGLSDIAIEVEHGVAEALARQFDASVITFGARGLVDMARSHVVKALLAWQADNGSATTRALRIVWDDANALALMADAPASCAKPALL